MEGEQKQQSTKNDSSESNNVGKDNEAYYVAKLSSDGNVDLTGVGNERFWEVLTTMLQQFYQK